jgi:CubicO group peptidase (beta-lactamase class C family)
MPIQAAQLALFEYLRNARFLIYLIVLALLAAPASQAQRVSANRRFASEVDAYLRPYLTFRGFSGSVLIARHGHILLSKGYGMANYELSVPNSPKTRFHLGSVSKTFTAAAIMMLQEQGKLDVHDHLNKFIPDYPTGDRITLGHLLSNTSGIPNINDFPDYNSISRFPHTPSDLIEHFKHKPLDFEPGSRAYTESNSNYNLLAFIIEEVSGEKYGDFLKRHIFNPLGLSATAHDGNASLLIPNEASGYMPVGIDGLENAPYLDWSTKTGNGSIDTTVADLYRWDRALRSENLLKQSSIGQMFSGQYGWFTGKRLDRNVVLMNGRSPGFSSEILRFVDDDVCIIVLANNYAPTASTIATELARMVFGEGYKALNLRRGIRADLAKLEAYVGRYQFGPDFLRPNAVYEFVVEEGQLTARSAAGSVPLAPQSKEEFFHRPFWSWLKFERDGQGRVDHLVWRFGEKEWRAIRM